MPTEIIQKIFLYAAKGKRRERRLVPNLNDPEFKTGATASNLKETIRFSSSRLNTCYALLRLNRNIASQMMHVVDRVEELMAGESMKIKLLRFAALEEDAVYDGIEDYCDCEGCYFERLDLEVDACERDLARMQRLRELFEGICGEEAVPSAVT